MNRNGFIVILGTVILAIGLGAGFLARIFFVEKNKQPDTYWRDENYEQIIPGKEPEFDTMNNTSVNLRSPIRKVYIGSNTNYIPAWTRENIRHKRVRE